MEKILKRYSVVTIGKALAGVAAAALVVLAFGITSAIHAAEPLTPKAAAEMLGQSSVQFDRHCTATKIGPAKFLTAAHCARSIQADWKISRLGKFDYQWVRSITVPVLEKDDDRVFDWAILHTAAENADIPALALGCGEDLYLGQPVAYYGFSNPLQVGFSVGYVASVTKTKTGPYNSDFMVDLQASPGSSGSAIVSLDTGQIIGVLVEGISESRAGVFLIGVQNIKHEDLCPSTDEPIVPQGTNLLTTPF